MQPDRKDPIYWVLSSKWLNEAQLINICNTLGRKRKRCFNCSRSLLSEATAQAQPAVPLNLPNIHLNKIARKWSFDNKMPQVKQNLIVADVKALLLFYQ